MTIYIHPYWLGVLTVIVAEIVFVIIVAVIEARKKKK